MYDALPQVPALADEGQQIIHACNFPIANRAFTYSFTGAHPANPRQHDILRHTLAASEMVAHRHGIAPEHPFIFNKLLLLMPDISNDVIATGCANIFCVHEQAFLDQTLHKKTQEVFHHPNCAG